MEISKTQVTDKILEINCSGPVSGDGLRELIDKVRTILSKKPEIKNILVDLTEIEGKLNFMEHF